MKSLRSSLFLILSMWSVSTALGGEKPPNVVLIFADDLGYGDLGCYGATKLKTPNIDRLAAEGRKFTDAHSSSAVCTPSRYGLLTGQYPYKANGGKGLWGPAPITSPLLIDPDTLTIADLFKKSGYDTAAFGKWHLGFGTGNNEWKEPLRPGPQDLGFDYYFGMPVVNSAPPYVYVENDRVVGSDPDDPLIHVGRNGKGVTPITPIPPEAAQRSPNQFTGAVEAHKLFNDFEVGTTLTEKATGWIKSRGGKPFFLYFATTNVHHPFTPAKQFQGTSECGVYGDFVHELDWIVGEVMKSLEAAGAADNTLVIFTSDNGGMFNLGGRAAAAKGHKINGDLLGSKFGIWEGGHRVPFIARWPGQIEADTVSDQMTISVDLLATFAALTGQELSAAEKKDSISMLPALTGNPEKPLRTEMFVTPHKQSHMAYRKGKWMFIPAKSDGGFRGSKPAQHAWGGAAVTKLVDTPNSDIENGKLKKNAAPAQLYDLEADVNQTENLFRTHPGVVREMAATLKKARQEAAGARTKEPKRQAATTNENKSPRPAATKPNVVVMFADDLGYGDLSCYNPKAARTPHLDALAAEGFRSTDFFVPANVCSPSRAALLTGRYPMRCGLPVARRANVPKYQNYGFAPDEITIPELLKPAGYRSLMVGKWHMGIEIAGSHPIDAGFDEHLGIPSNFSKARGPNHNTLYRGKKVQAKNVPFQELTKRYTDEVVAFIERKNDKPFFIYFAHHIPHTPILPRKEFLGTSGKGKYGDVIAELDHSVGRVMKAIRDAGLEKNTLVVFTSDNGPTRAGSTGGLNGGKYCTMEGGHRVPGIFRWPGQIAAKQVSDATLTSMDLLPLFCGLAGVTPPSDRKIDGKNILPILQGKETETPHKLLYYYNGTNLQAVREGNWKLHLPRTAQDQPFWCKKANGGRVLVTLEQPALFNLKDDLGEKRNVADQHPDVVARLQKGAEAIRKELGDVRVNGTDQRAINLVNPQER